VKRLAFPLLGIIFSTLIFLPIVRAEDTPQQGVTMTVYEGSPLGLIPWETTPDLPVCYSAVVPNIDFDWGGNPAAEGCPHNFFLVHFNGWLTVPESGQWEFLNWSDDGWRMTLDGVLTIDDWNFHGCGGHWSGPNEGYSQLVAGQSYALDIWMFEWGGGACARLWYGAPTLGYGVVPAEWLTTSALPAPEPSVPPTESPSPEPSLEPSPDPSAEPTPTPTESESIQPSPEPTPTPTESETPSVEPTPEPSPIATPQPSPTAEPTPVPTPTVTPTPTPTPVSTAEPSVEPSPTPEPSVEPTPTPEPSPDNIAEEAAAVVGETIAAVSEAVGEAAAAVAETVTQAVEAIANLGKDLSPVEKQKAAPVAVAIVISQVASAAVAAASNAASAAAASAARKASK
jgi:hypothetical protein